MLPTFLTTFTSRTPPDPPYVRCSSCEHVGPSSGAVYNFVLDGHGSHLMPPEYVCTGCGLRAPLTTDSPLACDTWVRCRRRWVCRHEFMVPAVAHAVTCPRCATVQAGPAA